MPMVPMELLRSDQTSYATAWDANSSPVRGRWHSMRTLGSAMGLMLTIAMLGWLGASFTGSSVSNLSVQVTAPKVAYSKAPNARIVKGMGGPRLRPLKSPAMSANKATHSNSKYEPNDGLELQRSHRSTPVATLGSGLWKPTDAEQEELPPNASTTSAVGYPWFSWGVLSMLVLAAIGAARWLQIPRPRPNGECGGYYDSEERSQFAMLAILDPVPRQQTQRQAITMPSVGISNGGLDNENADLILHVDDILQPFCGYSYRVVGMVGQGAFGQVAQCLVQETGEMVAVKVLKNHAKSYNAGCMEVQILQSLNSNYDANNQGHIVRLHDNFVHGGHLCLVFELLNVNLYELLKHNEFRGFSMHLVRRLSAQILASLTVLHDAKVIHCDLKPENVLLKGSKLDNIKVIDFGSACFENWTGETYIQSRWYRCPEVLLGHPYMMAIDMWSFGCIAAELFLGRALLPGNSEEDLLHRIVEMLGMPPREILAGGTNTSRYFADGGGDDCYRLRPQAGPPSRRYSKHTQLADIIRSYPMAEGVSPTNQQHNEREAFVDLLRGALNLDPTSRWTPRQALQHPFFTGSPFTGPFQPPADPVPVPEPHLTSSSSEGSRRR